MDIQTLRCTLLQKHKVLNVIILLCIITIALTIHVVDRRLFWRSENTLLADSGMHKVLADQPMSEKMHILRNKKTPLKSVGMNRTTTYQSVSENLHILSIEITQLRGIGMNKTTTYQPVSETQHILSNERKPLRSIGMNETTTYQSVSEKQHTLNNERKRLRTIGMNKTTTYQAVSETLHILSNKTITVAMLYFPDGHPFITLKISLFCGSNARCLFVDQNRTEEAEFIVMNSHRHLEENMNFYKEAFPIRPARHRLVLMDRESPVHIGLSLDKLRSLNGFFNFTASYSHRADAQYAYGECTERKHPRDISGVNFAFNKTRFAMWMASNCQATSKRELYIDELNKYMSIDIYGKCGTFKSHNCYAKPNPLKLVSCIENEQRLINQYKFYFAFENSFCEDYITEKVFRAIRGESNPLPIVMGGGPYDHYLPRGSYLDVNQFSSPKALADHLHFLDTNDEEYNKYFQWKAHHSCHWINNHCALCDSLYELRNKKNVARNVDQVFNPDQCGNNINASDWM